MQMIDELPSHVLDEPLRWFKREILRNPNVVIHVNFEQLAGRTRGNCAQVPPLFNELCGDGSDKDHYTIAVSLEVKDYYQYLNVLFHELVHVEQYVTGRLNTTKSHHQWLGENYWDVKKMAFFEEYWNFPWEVEARKRSTPLTEMFLDRFVHPINRRK